MEIEKEMARQREVQQKQEEEYKYVIKCQCFTGKNFPRRLKDKFLFNLKLNY